MRVLLLIGAAVVALGAVTVPLPWAVVEDATLTPAAPAVSLTFDPTLDEGGAATDREVTGEYLAVRHRNRAPAVHLLVAAVAPGARVEGAGDSASPRGVDPVVTAAMAGLGIVPRHADISELPVSATVEPGVNVRSLGVALYAFDVGSQLDVAQGRRIVGLGQVLDGGSLVCTSGVTSSVRAAAAQGVDVAVVPTECAAAAIDALPAGSTVQVLEAPVLASAAEALLESEEDSP